MIRAFLLFIVVVLVGASCQDNPETAVEKFNKQLNLDTLAINEFLTANNIVAARGNFGLRYVIHKEGTGRAPKYNSSLPGDCFQADYKGSLLSGSTFFDEGNDFRTSLSGSIIEGWKIGFQLLQEGDSATLYIPSTLGYRSTGSGTLIPPNSNLVFEVRLDRVITPYFNPASGGYNCDYLEPDVE
jgi:FKBP-type peptidyl-prolyl cis-trans isomerase